MTTTTYTATSPLNELLHWVRNEDFLTTTQRSVTTTSASGSVSGVTEYLINRTNIKNIRSITLDASPLIFGTDYDYAVDYNDSGTIKTRVTFTASKTGALIVNYDYGSDRIFTDYPRDDLSLNSYPRITVDLLTENVDAYGIGGGTFIENPLFTIIVYSQDQDEIRSIIDRIKSSLKTDAKNFYNYPFVKPTSKGPIIKDSNRNDTILHGNIDVAGMFKIGSV